MELSKEQEITAKTAKPAKKKKRKKKPKKAYLKDNGKRYIVKVWGKDWYWCGYTIKNDLQRAKVYRRKRDAKEAKTYAQKYCPQSFCIKEVEIIDD